MTIPKPFEGPWDKYASWNETWVDWQGQPEEPVLEEEVDRCVFAWESGEYQAYGAIHRLKDGRWAAYEGWAEVTGSSFHAAAYGGDGVVYVTDTLLQALLYAFGDEMRERVLPWIRSGELEDAEAAEWLALRDRERGVANDWLADRGMKMEEE